MTEYHYRVPVLSKNYQRAFDLMNIKTQQLFQMVYQSKNARGIGDHRSRLKKIILSTMSPDNKPTLFRSGCSSGCEILGFLQANQVVGTSLAYLQKGNLR